MHNKNSLIQYKIFEPYKNLLAFTTTRQTLSNHAPGFTGDEPSIYRDNRINLASLLNVAEKQLVFPRQTHANCVAAITTFPKLELKKTDALVTNKTGICLCVQTADCVPLLLFEPAKNVIGVVHSGWRGTVEKIAEVAVKKMVNKYDCQPANIIAAIGPSIGPEKYEVGAEVVDIIAKDIPVLKNALIKKSSGKIFFNLWKANRIILLECGLLKSNIEIAEECTFTVEDKYFSARREGAATGRMVSGIMLKESKF